MTHCGNCGEVLNDGDRFCGRCGARTSDETHIVRPVGGGLPAPAGVAAIAPSAPPVAATAGVEPGWHPDPRRRHEHRYWNGRKWTAHVADAGVVTVDPLAARPTPLPHPPGGAKTLTGWYPDPSGRHQHRFWDGRAWTSEVADAGATATDPPTLLGDE